MISVSWLIVVSVISTAVLTGLMIGAWMAGGAAEDKERSLADQVELYKSRWEESVDRSESFERALVFNPAKLIDWIQKEINRNVAHSDDPQVAANAQGRRQGLIAALLHVRSQL